MVTAIFTNAANVIGPQIAAQPTARLRLHAYLQAHVAYISSHFQYMMAVMEIASNVRTDEGKPRYTATTEKPVLKALETLDLAAVRNGIAVASTSRSE